MDTKWKSIRNKAKVFLAFFLCLGSGACLFLGLWFSEYIQYADKTAASYSLESYVFSYPTVQKAYARSTRILATMENSTGLSRERIEQGDFPLWNDYKAQLDSNREYRLETIRNEYVKSDNADPELLQRLDEANKSYEEREQAEKSLYIQVGLDRYDAYVSQLQQAGGGFLVFSFLGEPGAIPFHTPFDAGKYLYQPSANFYLNWGAKDEVRIYFGVDRSFAQRLFDNFGHIKWLGCVSAAGFVLAGLAGLAGAILLIVLACRKPQGEVCIRWWNYLFPDLTLGLAAAVVTVGVWLAPAVTQSLFQDAFSPAFYFALEAVLLSAAWLLTALAVSTAIKWGQKRLFWRHLLIIQPLRLLLFLLRRGKRACQSFFRRYHLKQAKSWQMLLLWLLSFLVTGLVAFVFSVIFSSFNRYYYETGWTWFGGILGFLLCALCLFSIFGRYCNALAALSLGVKKIKDGSLEEKIPPIRVHSLDQIAQDVNHIADGLRNAVEEEVASQRMKAELITNVSHDLKTPLTSIISYVDLLSKEPLSNETAKSYVSILQEKSEHLRLLIENLFEISKAESGNITVRLERLCLQDLLQQLLAEYEERFQSLGLAPRFRYPEEKIFVLGDSTILWRVFSNLLGNIVKYAMPQTRVYLDITVNGRMASVTLKNLSNYEMNFDEKEILQRFTRGEPSRTGEGSGLGLAIVDSFLTASNGDFQVVVDGDLFKAIVRLPLAGEPGDAAANPES